jgi:hypothetical protein
MSDAQWYLLKSSDRQVFGPVDHDTILGWASEAKISPLDKVSKDGRKSWLRAPMVDDLQMDWLIEMPDNYLYGPTNVGTIQEFLATGEIDGSVMLINCRTGVEARLESLPLFQASPHQTRGPETTFVGTQYSVHTTGDATLVNRIHALEKQLLDYQRVIDQWQEAYNGLRQQFIEATGREPL